MFVLYEFLGGRSFIDPICCNSCMVLSMFLRLVLANSLFSLRGINLILGLLPSRRHVVWRDSVGVEGSGPGLKIRVRGYFSSELILWLLRYTDEPQKGRNSCLWLQSCSVLSSFGAVLMFCRVNFHVVRSALQYSACRNYYVCIITGCTFLSTGRWAYRVLTSGGKGAYIRGAYNRMYFFCLKVDGKR